MDVLCLFTRLMSEASAFVATMMALKQLSCVRLVVAIAQAHSLAAHCPKASMLFIWEGMKMTVRITGEVEKLSAEESDLLFHRYVSLGLVTNHWQMWAKREVLLLVLQPGKRAPLLPEPSLSLL